jgi:hypothetical protein
MATCHLTGDNVKFVLEQPPVLCTLVHILEKQNCKEEAFNLKLVFKSNVTNDIVNKVFSNKIYEFNYNITKNERLARFKKTFFHLLSLNKKFLTLRRNRPPSNKGRKHTIKTVINVFKYMVIHKDIVHELSNRFKLAVIQKLNEFKINPIMIGKMETLYIQIFDIK